jgi:parallel beta-helix repeat protein
MRNKIASIILSVLIVLSTLLVHQINVAPHASPATPVHNINTGLNYTAIQAAIDDPQTLPGNTIMCDAGNYTENVQVYKSLTIIGAGPSVSGIIPSETDDTIRITASNVTIGGFAVQSVSGYSAIRLDEADDCIISNNTITGVGGGITLSGSNGNTVSNNVVLSQPGNGIWLTASSQRNTIVGNSLNSNHYGMELFNASNYNIIEDNFVNSSDFDGIRLNWQGAGFEPDEFNNITNNVATNNGGAGIFLDTSSPNNLLDDNFASDNYIGIRLRQANSSSVIHNNVISNSYLGISAESSYSNTFYDNFLNNTSNAWDNGANSWNTTRTQEVNILGRPFTGGNYWSDASNLPDSDNDGISETPYSVPGGSNIDMLPLVQSYIKVFPLEYDAATQTGTIRYEVDPTAFYRSQIQANGTVFDQIDLPSRDYYQQAGCGIPDDPMLGYTTNVSEPKMPVVQLCVGIPPEMEPESCLINDVECVGTIEHALIVPVPTYEASESSQTYVMNTTVYSSSEPYPSEWSSQPTVGTMDNIKTVTIELHPVIYIAANGTVNLYKMEGSIILEGQFEGWTPEKKGNSNLKLYVINGFEAGRFYPNPSLTHAIETSAVLKSIHWEYPFLWIATYSMLIISADDFSAQANHLAFEKSQRVQNPVVTGWITVSEIISVMQYYAAIGSDVPTMIRQFIDDVYSGWTTYPLRYVLLLGDISMTGMSYETVLPEDAKDNYGIFGPDCIQYPLGCDTADQTYAQSFTTGAEGVVSVSLLLNRTSALPNFTIDVSIRNTPNGPSLTNFTIDPADVQTGEITNATFMITRKFSYLTNTQNAELDPTQTYFLVINTTGISTQQKPGYYFIYTIGTGSTPSGRKDRPYEPAQEGCFWVNVLQGGSWIWQSRNEDLLFRLEILNSTSVPSIFVYSSLRSGSFADWDFPCDYYYACVDSGNPGGNWDPYGTGEYANNTALPSIDLKSEIAVGRLPAHNQAEASTMVDSIIAYETSPSRPKYMAGSVEYVAIDKKIGLICPDPSMTTTFGQYMEPFANLDSVLSQGSVSPTDVSTFGSLFNRPNGTDAVYLVDHGGINNIGSSTENERGMIENVGSTIYVCDNPPNPPPGGIWNYQLNATSNFPVVYAEACTTAYLDINPGDPQGSASWGPSNFTECLGETFVTQGVASSYIGFERESYGTPLGSNFWAYYCGEYGGSPWRTGDALMYAKNQLQHEDTYIVLSAILLGDPETNHYLPPTPQPFPLNCPVPIPQFNNLSPLDPEVNFTYTNSNETLYLPSTAPWEIFDPYGNSVYTPPAQQVITPVRPNGTISWTWNGTTSNGTQVSTPGRYWFCLHTLNGTLGNYFYMLIPDAWVFTTKPSYSFGEQVIVGFRNMGNETLTGDLALKRGGGTSSELSFCVPPGGDVECPCYVDNVTGQLNPPGEYSVEAVAEDPQGKTYNYTVEFTIQPTPPFTSTTVAQTSTHDVAVDDVSPLKTVVFQGFSGGVNVTVANDGGYTETFNVTVYANATSIASQNVTVSSGGFTTISFTWNTTGFAKGIYTISAYAEPVQGETNTANNNFTDGFVYVSMVGDLTGTTLFVPDGKCDGRDITVVVKCFGSKLGDPRYNPNCDIFNRGKIDGRDITVVAKNFGKHDP